MIFVVKVQLKIISLIFEYLFNNKNGFFTNNSFFQTDSQRYTNRLTLRDKLIPKNRNYCYFYSRK